MSFGKMRGEYKSPEGLIFQENFLNEEEEEALLKFISSISFEEVKIHDNVAKRQVKNYGYDYEFATRGIQLGEPIPEILLELGKRAAKFANIDPQEIAECLVSKYPPGAPIGWHRDAYVFGSKVIGVSLASSCIMRFQRVLSSKRLVYELKLPPRSIYVLSGEARYKWQHSIPPVKELRYSITFRTLKK